ncbi:MAG: GNAT family N-acetyltransferase [Clostridia bacterium]|nr:GNAT family N-acetyltransferase [Clostridia bacterium]
MVIRNAEKKDILGIMKLIGDCIENMQKQGIDQWCEKYPNLEIIEDDINKNTLYVLKERKSFLGIITIDEEQPPEYNQIKWCCEGKNVLVIHRLAIQPKVQGKGLGGKLMDFAEDFAIRFGYGCIRLDAYSGNEQTLGFYNRKGYMNVGEFTIAQRPLPFNCFEKILEGSVTL